jgi:hypothetical protein
MEGRPLPISRGQVIHEVLRNASLLKAQIVVWAARHPGTADFHVHLPFFSCDTATGFNGT